MLKISLITIGDELLKGSTLDTHLKFIGEELYSNGIKILHHETITDEKFDIHDTIKRNLEKYDIVITTGGLGPTPDDRTIQVIAELLEDNLIISNEVLSDIEYFFKQRNREVNTLSHDQALVFSKGNFLRNALGTAPGHHLRVNDSIKIDKLGNKHLFILQGVPYEMRNLFTKNVLPEIIKLNDMFELFRTFKTIGIGESDLVLKISNLKEIEEKCDIAFYPQNNGVKLVITKRGTDKNTLEKELDYLASLLLIDIEQFIVKENSSIEKEVVEKLKEKKLKISFAESCTGGLICSKIVSIPDASFVLDRSYVTYSNKAKFEVLNVNPYTLELSGAVSSETVDEMMEGLLAETDADIVAAISGIAGPGGGTKIKPVGTVFMGYRFRNGEKKIVKNFFTGERVDIQEKSANFLLDLIRKVL
ncbi:MAG: nicotinamide-nucleotide amidohydrolase family protein [Candidatus Delongbacteria bacterium]|nr:nicotinamide-nucleotide amidohydrolase family protein [Candidatus Delongbacteria bacterium]MBN2834232.1 nicotinamide-nucleotide amidohydrolase family protein [Candidatus Delongbacteria bacterium]